jgi:ribosomal protein S18 acetylase RimI-like enzyme
MLVLGALASLFTAVILSIRLARQHGYITQQYHHSKPVVAIEHASLKDIPLICLLAKQIWPKTYATIISKNQIDYMMKMMYSESTIKKQMEMLHQFIIAYNSGIPVGYAAYSEVESSIYKLHKIYVLHKQQGRGIGKFVIEQIMNDIREKGGTALRLNVNRHNTAKVFYEKLGFVVTGIEDADIGNGFFMNDYIMEKQLTAIVIPMDQNFESLSSES